MELAIIVLNYKTPQMSIQAAQDALASARHLKAHLYLIDNASGDGSSESLNAYAASQDHVTFIEAPSNGGFGAGHNIGFRAVLAEYAPEFIYIVNSDAFCEPNTIDALIAHLRTTPNAGAAGSRMSDKAGDLQYSAFRFPSASSEFENAARTGPITRVLRRHLITMPHQDTPFQADWVSGASVMFRSSALQDCGGFDEGFFLYFEELDLFQRFAQNGWQVWHVPHSHLVHLEGASTRLGTQPRKPTYWFNSRWRYYARYHGTLGALWITLARCVGGAIYRLRCVFEKQRYSEPQWFLTDMIRHHLKSAFSPPSHRLKNTVLHANFDELPK